MNSGIDLGMLTDVGRFCFHLYHLGFSWSGNFVSKPILKLEISLIIIFPRTKVGDVSPVSSKNYTRYCNTLLFVASVWCCRNFTSNWSSCLFQEISRIIVFVSSLLRCCLAHVSLVSFCETSSSSSSSAKLECYLGNSKPVSLKILTMFSLNVFADSTLSPSPTRHQHTFFLSFATAWGWSCSYRSKWCFMVPSSTNGDGESPNIRHVNRKITVFSISRSLIQLNLIASRSSSLILICRKACFLL